MSKQTMWALLKKKGFSDLAAATIMGHMVAESGCCAYRLQGDFTPGYSKSIIYTQQVDSGAISRYQFAHKGPNGGGYGACQWTFSSRKEGLYDTAKKMGESIGSENVVVEWLWAELHQGEYAAVLQSLTTGTSIRAMSDVFLKKFEKPADQSIDVQARRAALGAEIYEEFAGTVGGAQTVPEPATTLREVTDNWPPRTVCKGMVGFDVGVLQMILTSLGYDCKATAPEFDERTKVMLMAYQAEHALSSDGIAGPLSWGSLMARG